MTSPHLEGRKLSLSHLGICCFDLPKMIAFYTGVLGMTLSDRGALPERIGNGRYGWCFPAGDVDALAALLSACADDPARVATTGMAAIETRREHAPEHTVGHYAEQLAQWCAEHRRLHAA